MTDADRLAEAEEALQNIASWKDFYDRNVGAWDEDRYGHLTISAYARLTLDQLAEMDDD
jgi:hypothetical protein